MKRSLTLTFLISFMVVMTIQLHSGAQSPCFEKARTQKELNECAAADLSQADAELNQVYQRVLSRHADEPDAVTRIRKAQRAWIAFRDAEMEALFPESKRAQRGSSFEMCRLFQLTKLTQERTSELKTMLERREGDVCSQ